MRKLFGLSIMAAVIIMASIGCQNGPSLTDSGLDNTAPQALKFVPDGATLESATFHIFLNRPNDQEIFLHRITSDWDELTVTHNNFGGAFDATPEGSFLADGTGYKTVDITSLVASWEDGTFENFGVLLDQDLFNTPRARYFSKEYGVNPPMLEVCYDMNGESVCDTLLPIDDSYIWETRPDENFGLDTFLLTGWVVENDFEKQTLVRFMGEDTPDDQFGCTRTIGFWKNHAGFGPQADVLSQYLPITLGNGGGESVVVSDAATAVSIFTMGKNNAKNGIHKLMAQLLAAKLNIAAGASDDDIADFLSDADDFLTDYSSDDWGSLSKDMQKDVLGLKDSFDDYNNGFIGPGHCDDFGDDDEEEDED